MIHELMDSEARDQAHFAATEEGVERLREGDAEGAVEELTRVAIADGSNPYAFHFLGAAHFERKDLARALKAYLQAVELKPEYLGALIGVGWSLHGLGRFREAQRVGKQILARAKEDPDALHLLGLAHYALGDSAAARGYLERFLATRPELEVALEIEGLMEVLRAGNQPATEDD